MMIAAFLGKVIGASTAVAIFYVLFAIVALDYEYSAWPMWLRGVFVVMCAYGIWESFKTNPSGAHSEEHGGGTDADRR